MFRLLPTIAKNLLQRSSSLGSNTTVNCSLHVLSNLPTTIKPNLLSLSNLIVTQTCGFKVKGRLRRRCKDCYFVRRQERLYVICEKHPRHKQMSMVKDEHNTWILTHATQGKVRPW